METVRVEEHVHTLMLAVIFSFTFSPNSIHTVKLLYVIICGVSYKSLPNLHLLVIQLVASAKLFKHGPIRLKQ